MEPVMDKMRDHLIGERMFSFPSVLQGVDLTVKETCYPVSVTLTLMLVHCQITADLHRNFHGVSGSSMCVSFVKIRYLKIIPGSKS